jgi:hypothetical protein
MATVQLNKSEWQSYFDRLSKTLKDNRAEIEVNSLQLGSQIEAEWLPLYGITYDPKSDVVEVLLEGLDHLIHRPQTMFADYGADGLQNIAVIDADDTRQIVRLHDPLILPSTPGKT